MKKGKLSLLFGKKEEKENMQKEEIWGKSEPIGNDRSGLFACFGFKLIVLDALLKTSERMKEVFEEMQKHVDAYEYGTYTCIPEVIACLEEYCPTEEELAKVTELVFDGGLDIYGILMPDWDGESGEFDVRSVQGFQHLPNLRCVKYSSMCSEKLMDDFRSQGIQVL